MKYDYPRQQNMTKFIIPFIEIYNDDNTIVYNTENCIFIWSN